MSNRNYISFPRIHTTAISCAYNNNRFATFECSSRSVLSILSITSGDSTQYNKTHKILYNFSTTAAKNAEFDYHQSLPFNGTHKIRGPEIFYGPFPRNYISLAEIINYTLHLQDLQIIRSLTTTYIEVANNDEIQSLHSLSPPFSFALVFIEILENFTLSAYFSVKA